MHDTHVETSKRVVAQCLLVTMGDELHRLMPLHPFMLTATIWVSTPWLAVPLCRCSVCVSQ